MQRPYRLNKAFGKTEFGFTDLPFKLSGTTISRVLHGKEMGCCHCFPHGPETINSHVANTQRSWKKQRRTKWK